MDRYTLATLLAATTLMLAAPAPADAQLRVDLEIYWTWGDDGWRPHRTAYRSEGVIVHPSPYRAVRIPPGHLPPPGSCRVWYPGVPPGHQPPPRPCSYLLGARGGYGAVVIGGGGAYGHEVYGDGAYGGDIYEGERWERGGRGKARGRGRGKGRGGNPS